MTGELAARETVSEWLERFPTRQNRLVDQNSLKTRETGAIPDPCRSGIAPAGSRLAWMTRLALAVAILLPAPGALAQQVRDYLGVPGPIEIAGDRYGLAWSSAPRPGYFKQEYLPAGETPGRHSRMVLLEVISQGMDVAGAVRAQVANLNARKPQDPLVNMSVIRNARSGEVLLDFVLSGKRPDGQFIVEWNAYRYMPRQGGGVTLFGLSRRAEGDETARTFLTSLKGLRPQLIDVLARHAPPQPTIPR